MHILLGIVPLHLNLLNLLANLAPLSIGRISSIIGSRIFKFRIKSLWTNVMHIMHHVLFPEVILVKLHVIKMLTIYLFLLRTRRVDVSHLASLLAH